MYTDEKPIRIAMIVADHDFRDEEYAHPMTVFEEAGFQVTTVCGKLGGCTGRFGLRVEATLTLHDAIEKDWDAVVFVGGGGAQMYFDDEEAYGLARKPVSEGAVLGAICIAPTILGRAGLLSGLRATAFPSEQSELIADGAIWTGDAVDKALVPDTGAYVVTASGPDAASDFGAVIRDTLLER